MGFAGCAKNDGCVLGKDISPAVFENNPPEEANKLEPDVFEENNVFPRGLEPNPPCEALPNSELFPKLLKSEVGGTAFYIFFGSLVYFKPFFVYEEELTCFLSF